MIKDLRSRFGFHTTPFTRELAVRDRFSLEPQETALQALRRVVEERMSAVLVAPAGTGKSALLRALVESLPEARYRVHYVKVTSLSKRDLCREIAATIGVAPAGTFPSLFRKIQDRFLQTADTDGLRPVLLVDDAHDMRPEVLGLLRILTNYDMDSRLVLSFVLVGQLPLRRMLQREELEDVARRLAHFATLRPLSREETQRYIEHRVTISGAVENPFDSHAIDALYEIGRGNMRATDHLALKALEVAHDQDESVVDHNHVVHARKVLWP